MSAKNVRGGGRRGQMETGRWKLFHHDSFKLLILFGPTAVVVRVRLHLAGARDFRESCFRIPLFLFRSELSLPASAEPRETFNELISFLPGATLGDCVLFFLSGSFFAQLYYYYLISRSKG